MIISINYIRCLFSISCGRALHHLVCVCAQVVDEKPMVVCGGAPSGGSNGLAVKPLSPEQEELINRLVYFQEEFDQPSEEDLRKISVSRWLMKVKMLICMLILATTCVVI